VSGPNHALIKSSRFPAKSKMNLYLPHPPPGATELHPGSLYDRGIDACRREDRSSVRIIIAELISGLKQSHDRESADRLAAILEFCLNESALGELTIIAEIFEGLKTGRNESMMS